MNRCKVSHFSVTPGSCVLMVILLLASLPSATGSAEESLGPEATLRLIVEANAARDLATLSRYMSHDADAVGYTIDGHKYVGWPALEAEMRTEFSAVHKLELPITYLQVWERGEVAWFAMELDYIRYFSAGRPKSADGAPATRNWRSGAARRPLGSRRMA